MPSHPTVCLTDHKALLSVMTGNVFATGRLNRMSAESMEYDLHLCYRPGKLLDLADLMSRGRVEEDPETRKKMVHELIEWRAKQELRILQEQEERAAISTKFQTLRASAAVL